MKPGSEPVQDPRSCTWSPDSSGARACRSSKAKSNEQAGEQADDRSSGKKTKDGTPYLYYACVDYTKDGRQTSYPVKMLPAREFEALIKQALADLSNHPAILQACVDAANREAAQSLAELEAALARHRDETGRLTTSIRQLTGVIKQENLLAKDIKEEYRRLVREAADRHSIADAAAWATT
ncbi:MAG: hypothetical protein KatS3mg061_0480 [Dehalococcoidia bacterium]|nr:MAG: hypothetical protein KatS3mg061_0480 [Dehalococcoidia bacterium]